MSGILVQELEQNKEIDLGLVLMAGRKGLRRRISHPQVQKMGLALTGFTQFVEP